MVLGAGSRNANRMNVTWGVAHVDGMIVFRVAERAPCASGTWLARLEEAGNHPGSPRVFWSPLLEVVEGRGVRWHTWFKVDRPGNRFRTPTDGTTLFGGVAEQFKGGGLENRWAKAHRGSNPPPIFYSVVRDWKPRPHPVDEKAQAPSAGMAGLSEAAAERKGIPPSATFQIKEVSSGPLHTHAHRYWVGQRSSRHY